LSRRRYLSAREAAGELGVSVRTLYAYVSRGLIRSEAAGGRERRYRAEDVRRLRERKERRRDPEGAVRGALSWGTPVMESGITLITEAGLFYRGHDAVRLSRSCCIEEVAALIWLGDRSGVGELFGESPTLPERVRRLLPREGGLPPLEALQVALPLLAAEDPAAYDLRPGRAARVGARIVRLMAAVVAGAGECAGGVAGTLCRGWGLREEKAHRLLEAALVLCADHELPVSTFAARCAASSGATPYAAVSAGLAAFGGSRHGGMLYLVESFLREVEDAGGDARGAIGARLRRGDGVPGFGHSLYPDGDPRAAELLRRVGTELPESPGFRLAEGVVREVGEIVGERPAVDFALVALARAFGLPPGAAVALFAVGRAVGWIGHAIEQYASGSLIRPRARYVGEPPAGERG
jgi:citrate synthase